MDAVKKIEISHRTIIFTVFFLISLWLLWQVRQIILGLFVSVVLMAAINPAIDRMERIKIPRILSILFVYILILGVLGLIIAGIIPPLIDQTTTFISKVPNLIGGIPFIDKQIFDDQIRQLGSIPANLVKISVSIFTNLIGIFALLVITFYLLLERKNLDHYLHILFGGDGEEKAERFVDKLEKKLGGWVRAELSLMAIVGIMSYFGLRLLGIDFALPLALLAGIFEIIPNIGPVISAVPAILIGLAISPMTALAVGALYFLIQQIENSLIVPQIMAKETGVNPLVTIVSLMVGFKIGGVAGAILAIPVVLLGQIIASEVFSFKKS
jgi:predicted PurR-regulated permease PerM